MSDDNCQIFICHLPKDITRNELEEEFEEFGSIRKIEIKNKFAFIESKNAKFVYSQRFPCLARQ